MHQYRSHTCNELRESHVGQTVRVSGWLHNRRDHGGVLFIDLRDHYGLTQVVIHPEYTFQKQLAHLHKETVLEITGEVVMRSEDNINSNLPTGNIEIKVHSFKILNTCESLPINIFPEDEAPEETRLKYRYLDLRKSRLHHNIILRSQIISSIRKLMIKQGFNEFQTPILTSSSPEGARDYLVPSRLHPGKFYALPQAPQLYKQLLMVAGFDKYFQIAPCFRDEDARATRSPGEFYQLDIEMAFATQDDIFKVVETVLSGVFKEFSSWEGTDTPFLRIPYKDAMLKYGTDKPDLRIPIEIRDVSDIFHNSSFNAFRNVVERGGVVRAIPVEGIANKPRSFFDKLVEYAQSLGSQGLAYLVWDKVNDNNDVNDKDKDKNKDKYKVKGPIAKFLTQEQLAAIAKTCDINKNNGDNGNGDSNNNNHSNSDVVFFICNMPKEAEKLAGEIRIKLGEELDIIEKEVYKFCWVVDFPMYEYNDEQKCITFSHNPFSMPQGGLKTLNK